MISIYSGFSSITAVLSLAVSLLNLFWCPMAIFVTCCGCDDDALKEDRNKTIISIEASVEKEKEEEEEENEGEEQKSFEGEIENELKKQYQSTAVYTIPCDDDE